ncbi:MAG: SDR family NAD(P)-dependent oxidoreductase, partial [Rhodospirillaceae bacterium]|nr:SDR family NAD(P)-dependent oxidoreductase [Rhodospirillaceae bacterium]
MRREVNGRAVLITGAAGGLGAALCHRFAAAGARIAAQDVDAGRLAATTETLRAAGAEVLSIPGDIADPAACADMVAAVTERFGAIDGLINNAGISHRSLLADTDPAVIRRVMEVNFFGAANLTAAALPRLVARAGFVV